MRPVDNVILHELFIKFTNNIFKADGPLCQCVHLQVPNQGKILVLCHFTSFLGSPKIFSKASPHRGQSMCPNSVETCAVYETPHSKCHRLILYFSYYKSILIHHTRKKKKTMGKGLLSGNKDYALCQISINNLLPLMDTGTSRRKGSHFHTCSMPRLALLGLLKFFHFALKLCSKAVIQRCDCFSVSTSVLCC